MLLIDSSTLQRDLRKSAEQCERNRKQYSMTLQFDSNTAASALPVYLNSTPQASTITGMQPYPRTCALPLLDWSAFHPAGSEKTLQQLLQHIAQQLSCGVHIGRALPSGDVGTLFSSPDQKSGEVAASVPNQPTKRD
jgi:hypothetical protein